MAPQPAVDLVADASTTAPRLPSGGPVIQVRGLSRAFGQRWVLRDLQLEIAPGEIVALIGRSGTGKSTLLRALAGLDREVSGIFTVEGPLGVAFQDARLVPWKSVLDNVRLGLRVDDTTAVARSALAEVGLEAQADAWPATLSGGEAQRVSLARALARDPRVLLLDEPFGALDALTRLTMHELVLRLWSSHRPAIVLVTHDVDEALALADRILVLADGQIAYQSEVTLERPRDRDNEQLRLLRNRLLAELGVRRQAQD